MVQEDTGSRKRYLQCLLEIRDGPPTQNHSHRGLRTPTWVTGEIARSQSFGGRLYLYSWGIGSGSFRYFSWGKMSTLAHIYVLCSGWTGTMLLSEQNLPIEDKASRPDIMRRWDMRGERRGICLVRSWWHEI